MWPDLRLQVAMAQEGSGVALPIGSRKGVGSKGAQQPAGWGLSISGKCFLQQGIEQLQIGQSGDPFIL